MRRDFTANALPLEAGEYLAPGGAPTQYANWTTIFNEFESIISTCVSGSDPRDPGWGLVGDIVVSFWPRSCPVDQVFGFYSTGANSRARNSTVETVSGTLIPDVTGSALTVPYRTVIGGPGPTVSFSFGSGSGNAAGQTVNGNII